MGSTPGLGTFSLIGDLYFKWLKMSNLCFYLKKLDWVKFFLFWSFFTFISRKKCTNCTIWVEEKVV